MSKTALLQRNVEPEVTRRIPLSAYEDDEVYTVEQVAATLYKSVRYIKRKSSADGLKPHYIGERSVLFKGKTVKAWVDGLPTSWDASEKPAPDSPPASGASTSKKRGRTVADSVFRSL